MAGSTGGLNVGTRTTMGKRATAIIGACGEHYIAAYLSGFDLIVAMPRGGIPGCDLLVTRESKGRAIRL